ncbi:hypothetical protein [Flavobacterium agrisoli]|uniref:hypothetical protein n=1 Tax=Flavobacterium agrisoli TaxID=2793066 RepID=UPI001F225A53|nr:hypothetical protein [Flavobacterium agrisoli]
MSAISCSSELDFDQANDLKLTPVFVANLTYFNIPVSAFIENNIDGGVAIDVEDFSPFRDAFFRKNLKKTVLNFEVENSISRAFSVDLLLLNENNIPIDTIRLSVAASNGTTVTVNQTVVFEGERLEALQQMAQVGFIVKMAAGSPLTTDSVGSIQLRSSATIYLEIE